jgi:mono/diheme cytochrome c family protein
MALLLTLALMQAGLSACGERSGHDPFALMEGEGIYKAECAACHGVRLQGQPGWPARGPDGQLPAPPLDASGTAWQQPRPQLAAIVKQGRASADLPASAPADPAPAMPAFAGKLTDKQIDNVLAWVESQWPPDTLSQRASRLQTP